MIKLRDCGSIILANYKLCRLRLSDVDREQRTLRIQGKGGKERWVMLSPNGWYQLLSYLEQSRPKEVHSQGGDVEEDHLFLSEGYRPLSVNAITLLFDRLSSQRAGISEKPVSPSVLRDTFAVRSRQAGGQLEGLRDLLGLRDLTTLKRYARLSIQKSEKNQQKEPAEEHQSRQKPALPTSRRHRRRPSLVTPKQHQQQHTGRRDGSDGKVPGTDAEDDP